jgi:hypothetical protein
MNQLLDNFARLSPSNQRLVRELIWKLCQLEQLAIPEDHDARLDYGACLDRWLQYLVKDGFSPNTLAIYSRYVSWLLIDQQEVIDQHAKYSPLQQHLKGVSNAETLGE